MNSPAEARAEQLLWEGPREREARVESARHTGGTQMSNYTGPVVLVPFIGPRDSFMLILHSNVEDIDSIEKIVARYAEDGYKPDLKRVRKEYMSNGSLVAREPRTGPVGFPARSAFLRA